MPKWVEAKHIQPQAGPTPGQIDSLSFTSTITDSSGVLRIYLPAGYHGGKDKYPVAYVHDGITAMSRGKMPAALDFLIGKTVAPVIAVFIPSFFGGGYDEYNGAFKEIYARMCAEEIVPLIDRAYRTIPAPEARANLGTGFSALTAFYLTLNGPEKFGKAGMQSIFWDLEERRKHEPLIAKAGARKLALYLDWGKYDLRSPLEGFDLRNACQALVQLLKENGLKPQGGEVNEGFGWLSWRNRTDKVFESLFPLTELNGSQIRVDKK
jgi:enterochelin esterase-like enzyme